jgi:excisionase family DNA binding protein
VVSHDVSQKHRKALYLCGNNREFLWTKKFCENLFCGQHTLSIDSSTLRESSPHRFTCSHPFNHIPTMTGMKTFWIPFSQTTPHRYQLCTLILLGVFVRKLASDLPATLSLTTAASREIWEVRAMTSLLRISDAQERLAASRSTVYRLIRDRKLECVYLGSSPRIPDDSLERLIDDLRGQHATDRIGEAAS